MHGRLATTPIYSIATLDGPSFSAGEKAGMRACVPLTFPLCITKLRIQNHHRPNNFFHQELLGTTAGDDWALGADGPHWVCEGGAAWARAWEAACDLA